MAWPRAKGQLAAAARPGPATADGRSRSRTQRTSTTSTAKAAAALDLRDAAQLWYTCGGQRHPWSGALTDALAGATVAALEALLAAGEAEPVGPVAEALPSGGRVAAAQMVFRMGAQLDGGGGLAAPLRARLAVVVEALTLLALPPQPRLPADRRAPAAAAAAAGGARWSWGCSPPAARRRGGRRGRAASWGRRRGAARRGGARTLLALSGVRVYAPEGDARERVAGAVCGVLRKARPYDVTRLRAAEGAWDLWLPARDRALLAQKAGEDVWEGDR
ncbi:hypothetical protein HXX76_006135 [Chlamydomonas incerta]|uniref:Uncharacterized protein n=1 Tax=Chlamydomonas incerta TaxID=51695 RepID=A0A835W6J1_CHLIN|nr:hypothetical protein HXX76_006135 [Chlamydomonas incerta]|eukprot:KAG2437486.1 hypothetical protein HXX76_006135 [Chlamydomonas incerta]